MRRIPLVILLLAVSTRLAAAPTDTAPTPAAAVADLTRAVQAYESGRYDTAAALLEQTLAAAPECARCAHLLGKSYGRLAEQAGWLEAIGLARKTWRAFEQAAALAPHDREVIEDLIRYYRAAPAFLGGNSEKAEMLERRLRDSAGQTS